MDAETSALVIVANFVSAMMLRNINNIGDSVTWSIIKNLGNRLAETFGFASSTDSGIDWEKINWEAVSAESVRQIGSTPTIKSLSTSIVESIPVLKRGFAIAQESWRPRILWIDDNPRNNRYEIRLFHELGFEIDQVESTDEALTKLKEVKYDVLLSDIARGGESKAGLAMLEALTAGSPPIVFYVFDLESGVPSGAFGITNRPDELLHLVLEIRETNKTNSKAGLV